MRIGLDFDNTIVCYDKAISLLAEELFVLPNEIARTKLGLRDYLRAEGRESDWTAFQGQLYGPGMRYAEPFEEAVSTMKKLMADGHELIIVSHRSRWPYAGRRYDLHEAAKVWIESHLQTSGLFKDIAHAAYFLETKEQKLNKISDLGCEVFLDDLPEILSSPKFPDSTLGLLFRPDSQDDLERNDSTVSSWKDFSLLINNIL